MLNVWDCLSHFQRLVTACVSRTGVFYLQRRCKKEWPSPSNNLLNALLKVGSQCDARPCVAFICETQTFQIKIFIDFLMIKCKDAMERNARIESESILVSRCIAMSANAKATQHKAWCSVIL